MTTYARKPAATPEQLQKAIQNPLIYGRITVKDTREAGKSTIREILLMVEVWPEGWQESTNGFVTWKLWNTQCEEIGDVIKSRFHEHSGWVQVAGMHEESFVMSSGEKRTVMAAKSLHFGQWHPAPPDVRDQVLQLEQQLESIRVYLQTVEDRLVQLESGTPSSPVPEEKNDDGEESYFFQEEDILNL